MNAFKYLSPAEEENLLKKLKLAKRKQRLLQVRNQSRNISSRTRINAAVTKQKALEKIAASLCEEWVKERSDAISQLEAFYDGCVHGVGNSHSAAAKLLENEEKYEDTYKKLLENCRKADERFRVALSTLRKERERDVEERIRVAVYRRAALEGEKRRSRYVASLPLRSIIEEVLVEDSTVPVFDAAATGDVTQRRVDRHIVSKESLPGNQNAFTSARQFEESVSRKQAENKSQKADDDLKANLRFNHALSKARLEKEHTELLHELSLLQKADRLRRQSELDSIPRGVFVPPHLRELQKQDEQRSIEQSFEDAYMACTDYTGDVSVTLDALPGSQAKPLSSPIAETDLDLSRDSEQSFPSSVSSTPKIAIPPTTPGGLKPALSDITNSSMPTEETPKPSQSSDGSSSTETVSSLKRLMQHIRKQRLDWHHRVLSAEKPYDQQASSSSDGQPVRSLTDDLSAASSTDHTSSPVTVESEEERSLSQETISSGSMESKNVMSSSVPSETPERVLQSSDTKLTPKKADQPVKVVPSLDSGLGTVSAVSSQQKLKPKLDSNDQFVRDELGLGHPPDLSIDMATVRRYQKRLVSRYRKLASKTDENGDILPTIDESDLEKKLNLDQSVESEPRDEIRHFPSPGGQILKDESRSPHISFYSTSKSEVRSSLSPPRPQVKDNIPVSIERESQSYENALDSTLKNVEETEDNLPPFEAVERNDFIALVKQRDELNKRINDLLKADVSDTSLGRIDLFSSDVCTPNRSDIPEPRHSSLPEKSTPLKFDLINFKAQYPFVLKNTSHDRHTISESPKCEVESDTNVDHSLNKPFDLVRTQYLGASPLLPVLPDENFYPYVRQAKRDTEQHDILNVLDVQTPQADEKTHEISPRKGLVHSAGSVSLELTSMNDAVASQLSTVKREPNNTTTQPLDNFELTWKNDVLASQLSNVQQDQVNVPFTLSSSIPSFLENDLLSNSGLSSYSRFKSRPPVKHVLMDSSYPAHELSTIHEANTSAEFSPISPTQKFTQQEDSRSVNVTSFLEKSYSKEFFDDSNTPSTATKTTSTPASSLSISREIDFETTKSELLEDISKEIKASLQRFDELLAESKQFNLQCRVPPNAAYPSIEPDLQVTPPYLDQSPIQDEAELTFAESEAPFYELDASLLSSITEPAAASINTQELLTRCDRDVSGTSSDESVKTPVSAQYGYDVNQNFSVKSKSPVVPINTSTSSSFSELKQEYIPDSGRIERTSNPNSLSSLSQSSVNTTLLLERANFTEDETNVSLQPTLHVQSSPNSVKAPEPSALSVLSDNLSDTKASPPIQVWPPSLESQSNLVEFDTWLAGLGSSNIQSTQLTSRDFQPTSTVVSNSVVSEFQSLRSDQSLSNTDALPDLSVSVNSIDTDALIARADSNLPSSETGATSSTRSVETAVFKSLAIETSGNESNLRLSLRNSPEGSCSTASVDTTALLTRCGASDSLEQLPVGTTEFSNVDGNAVELSHRTRTTPDLSTSSIDTERLATILNIPGKSNVQTDWLHLKGAGANHTAVSGAVELSPRTLTTASSIDTERLITRLNISGQSNEQTEELRLKSAETSDNTAGPGTTEKMSSISLSSTSINTLEVLQRGGFSPTCTEDGNKEHLNTVGLEEPTPLYNNRSIDVSVPSNISVDTEKLLQMCGYESRDDSASELTASAVPVKSEQNSLVHSHAASVETNRLSVEGLDRDADSDVAASRNTASLLGSELTSAMDIPSSSSDSNGLQSNPPDLDISSVSFGSAPDMSKDSSLHFATKTSSPKTTASTTLGMADEITAAAVQPSDSLISFEHHEIETSVRSTTQVQDRPQSSRSRTKQQEAQMKQRTERLYSRLEEVQQRKREQQRKEEASRNRQRAKEFMQKQLRQVHKKAVHK